MLFHGVNSTKKNAFQVAMNKNFPKVSSAFDTKYKLERLIGKGGMGEVYLAFERSNNRKLAIKFFKRILFGDVVSQSHFVQEARLMATQAGNSPNLVKVFGFGTEGDHLYISFEFVDGITLRDALEQGSITTMKDVCTITLKVCYGLSLLHQKQIVHMDLKPENIMVSSDKSVKIIDLGVALSLQQRKEASSSGKILGTPLYMSPEQCLGETITYSSDLYSLGVMFYEMLAQVPPFYGDTPRVIKGHISEKPPLLTSYGIDVSPRLEKLVFSLLEKKPDSRPASAVVVAREIKSVLKDPANHTLLNRQFDSDRRCSPKAATLKFDKVRDRSPKREQQDPPQCSPDNSPSVIDDCSGSQVSKEVSCIDGFLKDARGGVSLRSFKVVLTFFIIGTVISVVLYSLFMSF